MRFALFEKDKGLEAAGEAYARWFAARLVKVEQRLEGRTYLCADRFTIADIAIGYALFLSTQVGLSDRLTPRASQYLKAMTARPAFKEAIETEKRLAEAQGVG